MPIILLFFAIFLKKCFILNSITIKNIVAKFVAQKIITQRSISSPSISGVTRNSKVIYKKWRFDIGGIKIVNSILINIRYFMSFLSNLKYLFILIKLNISVFF